MAFNLKQVFAWLIRGRAANMATLDRSGVADKWRSGSYGRDGAFGRPRGSQRWFRRSVRCGRVRGY